MLFQRFVVHTKLDVYFFIKEIRPPNKKEKMQVLLKGNLLHSPSVTGRWFSPGTPFSSTNKTDCHDIAEILLQVALNNITLTLTYKCRHTNILASRGSDLHLLFISRSTSHDP
jgi:hypothetical protein